MTKRSIGYLTSQYPAPSHTFIRREVAALREAGIAVTTYSIQRVVDPSDADLDRQAMAETFAVLAQSVKTYVRVHVGALIRHPGRYWQTWRLAWRHRVPGIRAAIWAQFHFAEAILLAQRLRIDGITHLHNHFANSGATVGLLASRYAKIGWSLTLHGISEFDYPAGPLLPAKIEAATFVACVSRFGMAQAMRQVRPDHWAKMNLVRCGVDMADLPTRRGGERAADGAGALRLVIVGRLSPEKGHAGLFKALSLLRARDVSTTLTLVGDGPESAALHHQAHIMGIEDQLSFVGRLDERATLAAIGQADVLVLPSFMEGLPVVLMEAMAIGVPVVASRVAGIPELVRDGESGLLFDPADWHALADAIARLAADPALRATLAEAGRRRVAEEFAISRAIAPLMTLLSAPA